MNAVIFFKINFTIQILIRGAVEKKIIIGWGRVVVNYTKREWFQFRVPTNKKFIAFAAPKFQVDGKLWHKDLRIHSLIGGEKSHVWYIRPLLINVHWSEFQFAPIWCQYLFIFRPIELGLEI